MDLSACRPVSVSTDSDWLEKRRTLGIGASEAPIVLGDSRWSSPFELYAQKIGAVDPTAETQAMRLGRAQERVALDEYWIDRGEGMEALNANPITFQSVEHPFLLATPDAFQWRKDRKTPGIVQVKATTMFGDWSDHMPVPVWEQMQQELAVTGLTWGTAVALLSTRLVWIDTERDDKFIDGFIVPQCRKFWKAVQDREPHFAAQGDHDATRRALEAIFPQDDGTTVHLEGEYTELHDQRLYYKEQMKQMGGELKRIDAELRAAIGAHTYGVLPTGDTYSLRRIDRKAYEVSPASYRKLHLTKGQAHVSTNRVIEGSHDTSRKDTDLEGEAV